MVEVLLVLLGGEHTQKEAPPTQVGRSAAYGRGTQEDREDKENSSQVPVVSLSIRDRQHARW